MRRLLTPVAKFWICKRGSHFAQEAMECLGGNGYVEAAGEGVMARIYREMPVNSIWEGAGNIMAIDLLRALRGADVLPALERELAPARGAHPPSTAPPALVLDSRRPRRARSAGAHPGARPGAGAAGGAAARGRHRPSCSTPSARRAWPPRPMSSACCPPASIWKRSSSAPCPNPTHRRPHEPFAGRHCRHHRRRLGLRPGGQPHRGAAGHEDRDGRRAGRCAGTVAPR